MNKSVTGVGLQLAQPFSVEDYELARATIVECCKATRRVRTRNAEGKIAYADEPDFAVRLAAARTVAEFVSGKPMTRSVVANVGQGVGQQSQPEFLHEVMRDRNAVAALRETMQKMVEAAERLQPIDISTEAAEEGDDKATAGDASARYSESAP
jgi:hypothetical protein